jgi:DegV family protein with EDD domain
MHLRRGGRLSNVAAIVGMVLNIKPLLKGNEEGKIVSFAKVRGRKKAIEALAERYDKLVVDPETQTVGIAQAGCREDAEMLISLLKQNRPPKEILTVEYEPVTGSHVGPGALALFFLSQEGVRSYNGESMPNILQQVVTKAGDTASEALNKFKRG